MNIGKPIRFISAACSAGAMTGLIVGFSHRIWLIILLFPIYLVMEFLINSFDTWLRRTTRDQLWLWSSAGKEWLKTPEGEKWKQKTGYQK